VLLERPCGYYRCLVLNQFPGRTDDDLYLTEIVRTLAKGPCRPERAHEPRTRDPVVLLHGFALTRETRCYVQQSYCSATPTMRAEFPQGVLRTAKFRGADRTEFLDGRRDSRQRLRASEESGTLGRAEGRKRFSINSFRKAHSGSLGPILGLQSCLGAKDYMAEG